MCNGGLCQLSQIKYPLGFKRIFVRFSRSHKLFLLIGLILRRNGSLLRKASHILGKLWSQHKYDSYRDQCKDGYNTFHLQDPDFLNDIDSNGIHQRMP